MRLSAPGSPVAPASPCHTVNALPYRAPLGEPVFTGVVDVRESIEGIINDTSGGKVIFLDNGCTIFVQAQRGHTFFSYWTHVVGSIINDI